jgi:hypothetical protein
MASLSQTNAVEPTTLAAFVLSQKKQQVGAGIILIVFHIPRGLLSHTSIVSQFPLVLRPISWVFIVTCLKAPGQR